MKHAFVQCLIKVVQINANCVCQLIDVCLTKAVSGPLSSVMWTKDYFCVNVTNGLVLV